LRYKIALTPKAIFDFNPSNSGTGKPIYYIHYMETIILAKPNKTGVFKRIMTTTKKVLGAKMTTPFSHY
jgi:hypothetical protein